MRRLILLAAAAALAGTGCKTLSTANLPWNEKAKVREVTELAPSRMAVIWSDAVLSNPGQTPVRGFGGRVYFYNDDGKTVAPEGQLVVYAFDDSRKEQASRVPDKKFAYTAEQFARHKSQSQLGPSFSIWLPWDGVDGEQREISLLPVFTTLEGKVVAGEQTINVLRGEKRPDHEESGGAGELSRVPRGQQGVRQVAHHESVEGQRAGGSSTVEMRTTTITVPRTLALQMTTPAQRPEAAETEQPIDHQDGGAQRAAPANSANFNSRSWSPPDPRQSRFVRPRSQALGAPLVRPRPVHAPTTPYPAGLPSAPPPPHSADQAAETGGASQTGSPSWQTPRN